MKGRVRIKTVMRRDGQDSIECDALLIGRFAVHPRSLLPFDSWRKERIYTITHVATGYAVCHLEARHRAVTTAKAIDATLGKKDITAADFDTKRYKQFIERARKIVAPLIAYRH